MWLLLVAALAVCAVVAIGAALNSGPKPQHARPRHLAAVPDPAPVGSMVLAEERAARLYWWPPLAAPAAEWNPAAPDWREQTAAELSPEVLDTHYQNPPSHNVVCAYEPLKCPWPDGWPPTDPGPGDVDMVSFAPGPDSDWLEAQLAILFDWVRSVHAGAIA